MNDAFKSPSGFHAMIDRGGGERWDRDMVGNVLRSGCIVLMAMTVSAAGLYVIMFG